MSRESKSYSSWFHHPKVWQDHQHMEYAWGNCQKENKQDQRSSCSEMRSPNHNTREGLFDEARGNCLPLSSTFSDLSTVSAFQALISVLPLNYQTSPPVLPWAFTHKISGLAVVTHAFNLSTLKAEAGGSQWVRGQPGLYREFQGSQGYPEKP